MISQFKMRLVLEYLHGKVLTKFDSLKRNQYAINFSLKLLLFYRETNSETICYDNKISWKKHHHFSFSNVSRKMVENVRHRFSSHIKYLSSINRYIRCIRLLSNDKHLLPKIVISNYQIRQTFNP